jgi:glutaredoxin 3
MEYNYNYREQCQGAGEEEQRMARTMQLVQRLVAENAVVVFSESGCCMCHVVKRLLCNLGVGPTIHELDEHAEGADIEKVLLRLDLGGNGDHRTNSVCNRAAAVPTVFVGGELLGGLDDVMASHVSGELVPLLKKAGALWL